MADGADTGLPRWDLSPLAVDSSVARDLLDKVVRQAEEFESYWRGTIATLSPVGFAQLVSGLNDLLALRDEVFCYVDLRESVDVSGEETRDLAAYAEGALTKVQNALLFFDLEWPALDEHKALELVSGSDLAADRKALLAERRFAPYRLSAEQEAVIEEREPLHEAWKKLHAQQLASIEAEFDGKPQTLDELLSYLHNPDRSKRFGATETAYAQVEPRADVLAACYDAIVADRLVIDRLRSHPGPRFNTDLENNLDPQVVDTMLDVVQSQYPIAQRWFEFKAGLLGLDKLHYVDQYAPLGRSRTVSWPEAAATVEDVFRSFHPELGELVNGFVAGHVDAEPRAGKIGGAFCAGISRRHLPYTLLNFSGTVSDVTTLAHEFGHGVHFALSLQHQSQSTAQIGTALCEIPSTFAELMTFDRLLETETDPGTRLALVASVAEDAFPTVFRQTMMAAYETRAYALRAAGKALTAERLSEIWLEENSRYFGDTIEIPDYYRYGWTYIPHFINSCFYTYAYSFANLVALCLYARYRADREGFPERYLGFLSAGASESPAELLAAFDIDLTDPAVWEEGFAEIERMVAEAEALLAAGV